MTERTKLEMPDGIIYEGDVVNGTPDGFGKMTFPSGQVYEGEFKNGLPNGKGVQYVSNDTVNWANGNYDIRRRIEATWENGSPVGKITEYRDGLPFDIELQNGEPIDCPMEVSFKESTLKYGSIRCVQSNQSGFFIETASAVLVFDWCRSVLPPIPDNKPVHVFISHVHADHFHYAVFGLADVISDIYFHLGYNHFNSGVNTLLDALPETVKNRLTFYDGVQQNRVGYVTVKSLPSTDLGVAFLVDVDRLKLFHAGDLAIWNGQENAFYKTLDLLDNTYIDFAMLPLDPRIGNYGAMTVIGYLSMVEIAVYAPMHVWENYDYISVFAKQYPQFGENMIGVNPGKANILMSVNLNEEYTINFE